MSSSSKPSPQQRDVDYQTLKEEVEVLCGNLAEAIGDCKGQEACREVEEKLGELQSQTFKQLGALEAGRASQEIKMSILKRQVEAREIEFGKLRNEVNELSEVMLATTTSAGALPPSQVEEDLRRQLERAHEQLREARERDRSRGCQQAKEIESVRSATSNGSPSEANLSRTDKYERLRSSSKQLALEPTIGSKNPFLLPLPPQPPPRALHVERECDRLRVEVRGLRDVISSLERKGTRGGPTALSSPRERELLDKIVALKSQASCYYDDFNAERRDREEAQSKKGELEVKVRKLEEELSSERREVQLGPSATTMLVPIW